MLPENHKIFYFYDVRETFRVLFLDVSEYLNLDKCLLAKFGSILDHF